VANALLRKLFTRSRPLLGEQPTDYESLKDSGAGGLAAEYEKIIEVQMRRMGISDGCASVEVRNTGQDAAGRDIFVGLVRLGGWERKSALRLLLGLPMLDTKVRRTIEGLWLGEVSSYGGLWLHAGGQLNEASAVTELRQLMMSLTGPRASPARR
jgi:hypothetical protein